MSSVSLTCYLQVDLESAIKSFLILIAVIFFMF
jgi:hypothetical protein